MQTLSYPFYPARARSNNRTDAIGLSVVILAHLLVFVIALWEPSKPPLPDTPVMAPRVMEAAIITVAPPQPPTELAPGPQQVEATAAPKPIEKTEETPELLTNDESLTTMDSSPQTEQPVQEEIPEPVEEEVITEQQAPAQPAPETTAPPSVEAPPAETATAATSGTNQQHLMEVQLNWQQQMQMHLERWKRYPRAAQMRNQEGMPWVKFSMDRNGNVLSVELVESSGVDSLDKEAIALVKRAEPLPAPPTEIEGDAITLTVPIEFFINR